ncbi:Yip1 family protein [Neptunomonas phycophila]|uniref:Yip1 family protein n=1 Tax=Neptunomonas phycophila TaxID=1572645 RepID=UPI0035113955
MSIDVINRVKTEPDELDLYAQEEAKQIDEEIRRLSLRPLLGMLRRPTHTMSEIMALNYPLYVPILMILVGGFCFALKMTSTSAINDMTSMIVPTLQGALQSLLTVFLISQLSRFTKERVGFRELVTVWGWSSVPLLGVFLVWWIRLMIPSASVDLDHPQQGVATSILLIVEFVFYAWNMWLTFVLVAWLVGSKWRATGLFLAANVIIIGGALSLYFAIL